MLQHDTRRVIVEFIAAETTDGFMLFAATTRALLVSNTSCASPHPYPGRLMSAAEAFAATLRCANIPAQMTLPPFIRPA